MSPLKLNKIKTTIYIVTLICLCFILFIKTHAEIIYTNLGDFYYKRNNVEKAVLYFEKALDRGAADTKLRETYVNSIINSPLTVENQEKLLKIINANINDTASRTAKYFLFNLKREINNKYPQNYVQQATYNGKILHWGEFPISYVVKNTKDIPKSFIEEIDNAFNEWERVSSCRVRFVKENIGSGDIEVEFIKEQTDNPVYGSKYVSAYTTPDVGQTKLNKMSIKINILDPEGKMFTQNQIYNTALHEIFHALGMMGHSYEPEDVMFMTKKHAVIINDERVKISDADKKTLELLYKIKPDITNENKIKYEYIPYLIIGNDAEINNFKKLEANNYIHNAPNLPGGYIDLAESFAAEGKYIEAIHNLEKALRLATDKETKYIIFYNMAVSYYKIDFYDIATDNIEKAFQLKDTEELHQLKAEINIKKNNIKDAIDEYTYLTEKNPHNIDYTIALANIYVKQHNYLKVRNIVKTYLKNNPKDKNNVRLKPYGILRF